MGDRHYVDYPVRSGVFVRFCREAEHIAGPCVFVIDEINRGNVARIFGELMLLLEYRDEAIPLQRSSEYTSYIIEAMETDKPYRVNVNVGNTGLITNLPPDCVVEVPCLVDGLGVHPCYVGDLPPQLAALNRTNINVQELAVKAALEGDRAALYQAVALDPLTSALLSFEEMRQMVDEMVEALSPWLPQFRSW